MVIENPIVKFIHSSRAIYSFTQLFMYSIIHVLMYSQPEPQPQPPPPTSSPLSPSFSLLRRQSWVRAHLRERK
jgi:hypothetical protein